MLAAAPRAEAAIAEWQLEAGVFLAVHFGWHQPSRVAVGLEVRELHAKREFTCAEGAAGSFGLIQRVTMVGWHQTRLTLGSRMGADGPHGGGGVEVALGYRLGRDPGALIELGADAALANMAFARVSVSPHVDAALGVGGLWAHQPTVNCEAPGTDVAAPATGQSDGATPGTGRQ